MKLIIPSFTLVFLCVTSMAQNVTSVFFSEYIKGNGNNNALEIFIPGDECARIEFDDLFGKITTAFKEREYITGLTSYLEENYRMLQFNSMEDPGLVTSSNLNHSTLKITVKEFNCNCETYDSRLIRIEYLQFQLAEEAFIELMNYTIRVGNDITVLDTEFANFDFCVLLT